MRQQPIERRILMKTLFVFSSIGVAVAGIVSAILGLIWIVTAIRRKKTTVKKAFASAIAATLICSVVNGVAYFKGVAPEQNNIPNSDGSYKKIETKAAKDESSATAPPVLDMNTDKETEAVKESETSQEPETSSIGEQVTEGSLSDEKPDYDEMIAQLEENVIDTVRKAAEGKFSHETEADITFEYFTGFVLVKMQYADNLTNELIKKGIWRDIGNTLSAVNFDAKGFDMVVNEELTVPCYAIERIGFNITAPNGDIILKAEYTKEDIQNTDWQNLTVNEIEALADWKDVSPNLK